MWKLVESAKDASFLELFDLVNGGTVSRVNSKKVVDYHCGSTKDNILVMYLLLHKVMKDIRNEANHASAHSSYNHAATKRAIEFYIKLVDVLLNNNLFAL